MIPEYSRKCERERACFLLKKYLSSLVTEGSHLAQEDIDMLVNIDFSDYVGNGIIKVKMN